MVSSAYGDFRQKGNNSEDQFKDSGSDSKGKEPEKVSLSAMRSIRPEYIDEFLPRATSLRTMVGLPVHSVNLGI